MQHKQIAEDFAAYLDLYYKYRDDYGVEEILAGKPRPAAFARLLNAPFDERLSLVSLLLAGLKSRFAESCRQNAVADDCYAMLRQLKQDLAALPDAELFETLKTIRGVGDKVANCICLFSYGRMGAAPVDTWIHKIMDREYGGRNPFPDYGEYAGILQQFAFYYAIAHKERFAGV